MKKKLPLLTSTAYFPPATWLPAGVRAGEWRIEQHENYQKGGFRNRCRIVGPNGVQTLSVPLVKGKNQRQPITEVRISHTSDWWRVHEQAIRTAYGRAPYFEYYADALFAVGRKQHEFLWQLNGELLNAVLQLLQNPVSVLPTEEFINPTASCFNRPVDLPDTLAEYPQVFTDRHGFTPGLSVLDGLFCLGPELITAWEDTK